VARAERRQQPAVVMTVDFNGFMPVGEEYRRGVSESLVVMLAQRLRACLRASDTVARLGYDEFGLLLEEIDDLGNVRILAERIIRSMAVPFIDESERVELVPNIGIAISTPERSAADDLLSDANIARAWARIQGSGRYVQFDGSMQMPAAELAGRDGADDHAASSTPSSDLVGSVDARFAELHERLSRIEEHLATIANLAGPNASRSWHSPE
jgi:diguanylate cyclase (GGDEF)-like protein